MIGRFLAFCAVTLGLTGPLTGCDDVKISGIERRVYFNANNLAKLPEFDGLLVEIHGAPWPGADPDQIASTLRMPDGVAKTVRFRAIAPGQWIIGGGKRLVLHFNPTGAPNHVADCRAKKAFQTKPPAKKGFSVSATYCEKDAWQIHAHLKAPSISQDDWFGYTMVMRKLLGRLFPEE